MRTRKVDSTARKRQSGGVLGQPKWSLKRLLVRPVSLALRCGVMMAPILAALVGRYRKKKIDVGLGPEPLINNVYHKRALQAYGYTAETFVSATSFITDEFDIHLDRLCRHRLLGWLPSLITSALRRAYFLSFPFWRYRCLYIYFNGGPLGAGFRNRLLGRLEPWLLWLSRTKVVVMPYGGDVNEMTRATNLNYKHALAADYPKHHLRRKLTEAQIDRWTRYADHVISGCDWVDYMYHWDTLMLAHFSIDTEAWKPVADAEAPRSEKVRILHAPNHRTIKGSRFFIAAVNELIEEGLPVELVILEGVPNDEIKRVMATVDVVADQLIVGWYAMFALEAMAMGKPVLCYLREDLESLYVGAGLVALGEIPLINCTPVTVKDVIRSLVTDREHLHEIGKRSREYVIRYHSIESVGARFGCINRSLGIAPRSPNESSNQSSVVA